MHYSAKLSKMDIIGHVTRDFLIEEHSTLQGMVSGNIVVANSATLVIGGMLNGALDISAGSKAIVTGMVNGSITNAGICDIGGTVSGTLKNNGGIFNIDANAIIGPSNQDHIYELVGKQPLF